LSNQKISRLFFTIGIIVAYRFATYITIPGLDLSVVSKFYSENSSILSIFNTLAGGAVSRMSIMALNLIPYVSASIIMQLLTSVIPEWKELKRDSYQRRKISRYSRMMALAISFVQALGIAIGLENVPQLVLNPGLLFKVTTVISIMSASIFVMWLSERIGERGIGNGSSVIIFTGILANSAPNGLLMVKQYLNSTSSAHMLKWILLTFGVFVLGIVFCEMLRYNIRVFFKHSSLISYNNPELASNVVPIKINPAGILPAMFSDSMMVVPSVIMRLAETKLGLSLGEAGVYVSLFLRSLLIVFFCIFCLSFVMNPEDVAENLRSRNAYIDKVPEGTATASYFEGLLNKISVLGCVYTLLVTVGPDLMSMLFLKSRAGVLMSGTSLLIVISVAIEIYSRLAPEPVLPKVNRKESAQ
jgi:preprotein translocase subunit SecY